MTQHTPAQSGHPTPRAAREVAARFHRAAKRRGIVDMKEDSVRTRSRDHTCGTVACAAGHYMLQRAIDKLETVADGMDWKHGTRMIANDLGMENEEHLMGWADANPQLWGNADGWEMFYEEQAYDSSEPTRTLSDIARHWDRVASRLRIERLDQLEKPE